jgi:gamma-glutamylcyclotransferase (GGCT)/AIG2-like uncharacterized protein YtfP
MSEPAHLFVYGTLRAESGHPMARRLRARARLVGKGSVPGRLYDIGWYPAGVFDANEKRRIHGDVFALPPGGKLLAEMDAYEGTDPEYARLPLDITLDDGRIVRAWTYIVRRAPNARLIHSGDFIAHRNAKTPRPVRP